MPKLELEAQPKQDDLLTVLDYPEDRLAVLFGGAMGGGKSYGIAIAGLVLSCQYPRNRGFVGRLDFADLRETTYETCISVWGDLGLLDPVAGGQHHKSEHWVRFPNGSTVLFGELKDPESRKSLNLGWFAIDEATEVPENSYQMLLSRLRLPGVKYRAILASNPEPGWVKRRFVDEPRQPGHYFIRSLPDDNPALPADYVASLQATFSDIWVKRYLSGSWDAFEGAVFDEFDRRRHVAPPLEPPAHWPRLRAIDHGLHNATCCLWFARDEKGVIHVYDEHYLAGQPVSVHAAAIKAKSHGLNLPTVIDPSTQQTKDIRGGIPWTVRMEYAEAGITTDLANNARMASIIRIKELLRLDQLVIHANCVNLLRELPEYQWKDAGDTERPEDARKVNDHAVDALRYGVVVAVQRPQTPTPLQFGGRRGRY